MGWRLNGRTLRKSSSPVVVGIVAGAILLTPFLLNHQRAMGQWGPCTEDDPGYFTNTITCFQGMCSGQVTIKPRQASCKSMDETACTDLPNNFFVLYSWKQTNLGWGAMVSCVAATGPCSICIAIAAAFCTVPPWWDCIIGAGGCAIPCYMYAPDPCCWLTCTQDILTRFPIGGGVTC